MRIPKCVVHYHQWESEAASLADCAPLSCVDLETEHDPFSYLIEKGRFEAVDSRFGKHLDSIDLSSDRGAYVRRGIG